MNDTDKQLKIKNIKALFMKSGWTTKRLSKESGYSEKKIYMIRMGIGKHSDECLQNIENILLKIFK